MGLFEKAMQHGEAIATSGYLLRRVEELKSQLAELQTKLSTAEAERDAAREESQASDESYIALSNDYNKEIPRRRALEDELTTLHTKVEELEENEQGYITKALEWLKQEEPPADAGEEG